MRPSKRNVIVVWGAAFGVIAVLLFILIIQSANKEQTTAQLTSKPWTWLSLTRSSGQEIKPQQPDSFILSFETNSRFSSTTDCNGMAGIFSTENSKIYFSDVASTMMYCEGSKEQTYSQIFADARTFTITRDGILEIKLQNDSIARFR